MFLWKSVVGTAFLKEAIPQTSMLISRVTVSPPPFAHHEGGPEPAHHRASCACAPLDAKAGSEATTPANHQGRRTNGRSIVGTSQGHGATQVDQDKADLRAGSEMDGLFHAMLAACTGPDPSCNRTRSTGSSRLRRNDSSGREMALSGLRSWAMGEQEP